MGGSKLSITFNLTTVKSGPILTRSPDTGHWSMARAVKRTLTIHRREVRRYMNSLLFLLAGAGILLAAAMRETKKLRKTLGPGKPRSFLPKAVTLLIVSAQLSELLKVVSQASVMHLVATLFLLAIVTAVQSGTESEWR